ncbi:sulfotransferase 16, CORONATINE INDUCED-7, SULFOTRANSFERASE 16, ARABIDOPSIS SULFOTRANSFERASE 5A [Hibiscus trionum]|uniref:Sulfotransferase n=1 Tax=Hibiscus trionum TaxID=183268 RepID=A0A9W7IPV1_HIBTR|nr:sulfotransferase 16, CORONATINE INDUCED-7, SULFOTRANSFERASE 16, ARABIDOPSIS SULFOTRANSFERASE 5A [Hibiscus trionum]
MDSPSKDVEFEKSFNEMISTLPKRKSWGIPEDYFQYQGFWLHPTYLKGVVSAQQQFQAQSTDIMLCNLPKTGTTWLKSLIFAIVTRASFDDSTSPLLSKLPHEVVPFMELYHADFPTYRDHGVPVLATHVPYSSLPRSILDSGCKIVYVCRNPKDSFVSLYHFNTTILTSMNLQPLDLYEAFEMFCEGVSVYGPYWDHVLGYWKASLEHPDKILFLQYEEMKDDNVLYVKKLAEFIGYPFTSDEHRTEVPEKIVKMCSFENLSNLEVNRSEKGGMIQNNMYFRKGKVGDWMNCLTSEMAERLDRITQQKLSGSGLSIHF